MPDATSQLAAPPTDQTPTRLAAAMIDLHAVRRSYGERDSAFDALADISFRIDRGRAVALLGRSGSGKSTLLNLLGAVDRPTAGSVRIAGQDLSKLSDAELTLFRRRRLGFVFQSFHLLPSLTAFDNVAVPWLLDRALTRERRLEIQSLLERLGVGEKSNRFPDELSGGQQQRVALARAVVHRPELLLADEPTGNLDAQSGRLILDLIFQLQREYGLTVVMATHSDEAAGRCEDRLVLEDGRIVASHGCVEVAR